MINNHLLKCLYAVSKQLQPLGTAIVASTIKKGKKMDRELTQLKKMLASKQPVQSQSLYDQYHHREIYNRINTDLQSFFYKRQYSLQNFNFLINLLGHQKKIQNIEEVMQKMRFLNIQPDQRTFNYLIRAASHMGDIEKSQAYFKEAVQKFGESKYFYTSLMTVYKDNRNPQMAYQIVQEMIEKGLQPDLPVYTTLINAFRIDRRLQKCWQINRMLLKKKNVELDESYVGVMLKVHAATHDAQKAVKLYQENIIAKNVKPMLETINSYFKALASRPEYATRVIDKFFNMIENGDIINQQTIRWALKAAATTAGINSAIEIVKIMKLKNIQPTKQIYNSLIRVYAKGCDLPDITESYRQMMLMDTWKLLQEVIAKDMLDTTILNNVMLVHANALSQDKIEGLIIPLFDKYNLQMNPYSFQILIDLNYRKKDFNTAVHLYKKLQQKLEERQKTHIEKYGVYKTNMELMRQEMRPTFNILQTYIQIGIRTMNMNMILEALETFKKLNRHPKNSTLKFLGNLKNLPQEIVVSLMDFKIRFGAAKTTKSKSDGQRNVPDPQDL